MGAVDDRTEEERGLKVSCCQAAYSWCCVTSFSFFWQPLKEDKFVIPKSRYDTIDCYLASAEYNDREVPYDPAVFQQLIDGGMR